MVVVAVIMGVVEVEAVHGALVVGEHLMHLEEVMVVLMEAAAEEGEDMGGMFMMAHFAICGEVLEDLVVHMVVEEEMELQIIIIERQHLLEDLVLILHHGQTYIMMEMRILEDTVVEELQIHLFIVLEVEVEEDLAVMAELVMALEVEVEEDMVVMAVTDLVRNLLDLHQVLIVMEVEGEEDLVEMVVNKLEVEEGMENLLLEETNVEVEEDIMVEEETVKEELVLVEVEEDMEMEGMEEQQEIAENLAEVEEGEIHLEEMVFVSSNIMLNFFLLTV